MITHQILITFDSARDFRDRQFANYDSTLMHWFLVRDKMCWWLTAEAGGFAERISQPKVTGQQVEQFMFSVFKKRGLLDDETLVSFSEVTWVIVPKIPARVTKVIFPDQPVTHRGTQWLFMWH